MLRFWQRKKVTEAIQPAESRPVEDPLRPLAEDTGLLFLHSFTRNLPERDEGVLNLIAASINTVFGASVRPDDILVVERPFTYGAQRDYLLGFSLQMVVVQPGSDADLLIQPYCYFCGGLPTDNTIRVFEYAFSIPLREKPDEVPATVRSYARRRLRFLLEYLERHLQNHHHQKPLWSRIPAGGPARKGGDGDAESSAPAVE